MLPLLVDMAIHRAEIPTLFEDRDIAQETKGTPCTAFPAHWSAARRAAELARQGGSKSRLESGVASFLSCKSVSETDTPAEELQAQERRSTTMRQPPRRSSYPVPSLGFC